VVAPTRPSSKGTALEPESSLFFYVQFNSSCKEEMTWICIVGVAVAGALLLCLHGLQATAQPMVPAVTDDLDERLAGLQCMEPFRQKVRAPSLDFYTSLCKAPSRNLLNKPAVVWQGSSYTTSVYTASETLENALLKT
jgi:hypothetical protein